MPVTNLLHMGWRALAGCLPLLLGLLLTVEVCADPPAAKQAPDAGAAQFRTPRGIFLLQSSDRRSVPDESLSLPSVAGLSIRVSWQKLEPRENQYDWSFLDDELARVKKLDKTVQLRIMTGTSAPAWLYEAGVASLEFRDERKGSESFKMPLPWDPTLQAKWLQFCRALGKRYADNPSIVLVHISGATRFSAEMHLPLELTQHPDFSSAKVVAGWDAATAALDEAFPHTALALDISKAVSPRDGIPAAIIKLCQKRLGARACFQHNALAAKTPAGSFAHRLVAQTGKDGQTIGFQMLSDSRHPRFGGNLETALDKAVEAKAQYVEVYPNEAVDQAAVLVRFAPRFAKEPQK